MYQVVDDHRYTMAQQYIWAWKRTQKRVFLDATGRVWDCWVAAGCPCGTMSVDQT